MREPILTTLVVLAPAALHREAWRALLSSRPGIRVAGVVGEATEVSALVPAGRPATVLIDLPAPDPDLTRRLKAAAPEAGLLFLVSSYELAEILPLLQAGATGCVSREDSAGDLTRAVIAAGRGETVLPPSGAAQALVALARGQNPDGPAGQGDRVPLVESLSEREADVLRSLAQGHTNKDIAQALFLSVRTVEAHLRSVYGKLGVRSRTEAALWAVKHNYGPLA